MDDARRVHTDTSRYYVSTGYLPTLDIIAALVSEAHQRFKSNTEGKKPDVYPALATVPGELFGVCIVGTNGSACSWRYRL